MTAPATNPMLMMRAKASVINGVGGAVDDEATGGVAVVWLTTVWDAVSQSDAVCDIGSADIDCRDGRTEVVDVFTANDPTGFTATAKYEKPGVSALK